MRQLSFMSKNGAGCMAKRKLRDLIKIPNWKYLIYFHDRNNPKTVAATLREIVFREIWSKVVIE